jgi:hypothetical protein
MREIRQSGSEGGVGFKPPSLPLFYSNEDPQIILFVFRRRGTRSISQGWSVVGRGYLGRARRCTCRAAEKQKE